jgi:hypothetical protein
MRFSHILSTAGITIGALGIALVFGTPAQAETLRLADNHTGGMVNTTEQSMDDGMTIVEVASS